ncbi:universal stress protein [Pseudodesulfovibrio cashew]|uniref:Universal stress protein n=1 Tax=Pseudodesulfovibrio cashew TaxID=2678688 RepID=A0A6I6JE28_9BACT|nr:universal stress protein [Pseudodesulfovibrio cashew]QGY39429.1 universal stress protein [Pseudodesulfovibrio cashew]
MQKELLLAISEDRSASYNLRFLREVFSTFCDLKLTLFYVTPYKPSWGMSQSDVAPRTAGFDETMHFTEGSGQGALGDAERWIKEVAGCTGENVRTKVAHSRRGTVPELIEEAHNGMYDALLLGRRTFTWFEEIFENSVSHEMLLSDIDFPLWICKRPPDSLEAPRHDVLLALDGSEPSKRMVDHAAYMLADELRHTFTLFHVAEKGYGADHAARLFDEALAILKNNGVEEERIEMKTAMGKSPVKAILTEVREGNYSAVGVGKHGESSDHKARGLFPSSVTVNLLRQLENSALWISK